MARLIQKLTAILVVLAAHTVGADTLEWSDPISGDFDDATKWTVTAGAGSSPPAAGDSIFLNEAGTYTIALTQGEAADFLRTTSGTVSLLSDSAASRTLDLTTGNADLSVRGGGTLNVGSASNPVIINVGDRFEVAHGSGGGAGTVNVAGAATELNVLGVTTHNFGISGQVAVVNVTDDASLSFAAGSTLAIGRSGSNSSDGRIAISGGGDLVAGNIDLSMLTSAAFGSLSVSGAGSTATQIGTATLNVGSGSGGQGVLTIDDQAVFSSVESNVNPTGRVTVGSGSSWLVTGQLAIDGGAEVLLDAGTLDTTAGAGPAGPIVNGLLSTENSSTVTGGAFQSLSIGAGGIGTMEVRSGSTVTSDFGSIGSILDSTAGDGSVLIDGAGSSWQVTGEFVGNFTIGSSAQGSLTVQNGGLVLGDNVEVGNLAGATGDVTVDGAGSRLESTDEMTIGDQGSGTLLARNQAGVVVANRFTVGDEATASATIESGATLSTGITDIGDRDGAIGTVTIDSAAWVATGSIGVGREGTGTLTIQNGASVESTTGVVGSSIGAGGPGDGTLNLSGGSTWTMSDRFTVGGAGNGIATIGGASTVTSVGGLVSGNNSATGDLTVTGAATTWTNNGDLALGQGGTASLLVSDGATVSNVNASIGVSSNAAMTASVTVEDTGSVWTNSGDLFLAGSNSSSNGSDGDLTVRNGGVVQVDGGTTIHGNGIVSIDGGVLNANGGLDNMAGGTLNLTSGSLSVSGGAFVPNSGGGFAVENDFHVSLDNGATANFAGELVVGTSSNARVSIVDTAQVVSDSGLILGGGSTSPDSDAASVTIDGVGTGWTMTGDLNVGAEATDRVSEGRRGELAITGGAVVENADANVGFRSSTLGGVNPPLSLVPVRVTVSGVGSRWQNTGSVSIGLFQVGRVLIDDGASVESESLRLGPSAIVDVNGAGTRWDVTDELRVESGANTSILLGGGSLGMLVRDGATLAVDSALLRGAGLSPDDAVVEVRSTGSLFSVAGLLEVGRLGAGTLRVLDGGRTTSGSAVVGTLDVGPIGEGEKLVVVSGAGSEWLNAGNLAVGGDLAGPGDRGVVRLESEGMLSVGGAFSLWEPGTLTLDGGALRLDSSQATIEGTLAFNTGTLILADASGYAVGSGVPFVEDLIGDTAVVLNRGKSFRVENTLTVPAGTSITQVDGDLAADTLDNSGLVNVNGTTITTAVGLDNGGQLVLIDATVEGPVENVAGAAITVIGSTDFNGTVTGPGGFFGPGVANFNGVLSLGASPAEVAFEGSVALSETSELIVELGGTAAGEFDRLVVGGDLSLGGDLRVELLEGFMPELGDVFEFASVTGDFTGEFDAELLPGLGPQHTMQLLRTDDAATLVVTPTLAGDYNADGTVNAADYSVWRDSRDATGIGLAADGDLNGVVDADDYDIWRNNYGASLSAPQDSAAVPEPVSGYLALAGILFRLSRRPHRLCRSHQPR